MKKIIALVCVMLLLSGCSVQTFEGVEDLNDVQAVANPATLLLDLPEEASVSAMQGSSGTLYFCDDYDIMVEVMPSGNLSNTLQILTGFEREELDLMQSGKRLKVLNILNRHIYTKKTVLRKEREQRN